MPEERTSTLVALGEESELKIELNKGVASLQKADESCFQPHTCLNGVDGMRVITQISQGPEIANTEFWISDMTVCASGDIWVNIVFLVSLDQNSSNSVARLSPRQTAYIIKNLPDNLFGIVTEKVKRWHLERYLKNMERGLATITAQVEKGDYLLESCHGNRIFDVHDANHPLSPPYTEWSIAGENLFPEFFYCHTIDGSRDRREGYEEMDRFIEASKLATKQRANQFVGALQTLSNFLR